MDRLPGRGGRPAFAMAQSLAPERLRAMAAAIVLLLANLFGMGLGPLVVGVASDALMVAVVANVWAAAHYLRAGRTLRSELDGVR